MQTQSNGDLPIAGDIYGSITLTGKFHYVKESGSRRLRAEGTCKCGDIRDYAFRYLKSGITKSCGCGRREGIKNSLTTHNISHHALYQAYKDMIRRCYKTNSKYYCNYGARGITVCSEWREDIMAFYNWGLANGWQKGLELDRRENEGNYEPSNCRFITRAVGNTNTRRNINVTAFGETKTATEWSRDKRCKVASRTVLERIKNGKWDAEQAITTPANDRKLEFSREISTVRKITAWGETKCLKEWSEDKRCNVGYSGLKIRLAKGWDAEKAISESFRSK